MVGHKFRPGSTEAQSLTAATSGTGTAKALNDCRQGTWTVTGNGTTSGGVVKIETSNDASYTGTWAEIDSVNASDVSGDKKYTSTYPGLLAFTRGRIPTGSEITGGGSVDVEINGILN